MVGRDVPDKDPIKLKFKNNKHSRNKNQRPHSSSSPSAAALLFFFFAFFLLIFFSNSVRLIFSAVFFGLASSLCEPLQSSRVLVIGEVTALFSDKRRAYASHRHPLPS